MVMPQLRVTEPNNNKALSAGLSGAGSTFAAFQFYATFKWLWLTSVGVPENVADELTVACNMAIAFAFSYLVTWLTPSRSIVTPPPVEG